jgi:hypothetical protein
MNTHPVRSAPWVGLVLLVGAGVIGVRAVAQEPAPTAVHPVQRCRLFPLADVEKDRELNTEDRSSEVGQWVTAREAEGWTVAGVDFEIGQKSTGYPQGWQQVCMARR